MTPSRVAVYTFLLSFWGVVVIFFPPVFPVTCACLSSLPAHLDEQKVGSRGTLCVLHSVVFAQLLHLTCLSGPQSNHRDGCSLIIFGTSKSMINHQWSNFYHKEEKKKNSIYAIWRWCTSLERGLKVVSYLLLFSILATMAVCDQ